MSTTKRTAAGWAKHRAQANEIKKIKRQDPEYRKKEAEKAKERYYKNRDKYVAISKKWQEKNKESYSEQRKRRRRENPELTRLNDKKWRDNSIKSTITKFRRGDIGLSELDRRLSETYFRYNEKYKTK